MPGELYMSVAPPATLQVSLLEPSPHWLGIHGDAGALLSVGLMRRLDWGSFEACVHNVAFFGETLSNVCRFATSCSPYSITG